MKIKDIDKILENIKDILKRIELEPDDGTLLIYIGIVKEVNNNRKVNKLLVLKSENFENVKRTLESKRTYCIINEGEHVPGSCIMLVFTIGKTRHEAIEKLRESVDLVKKNLLKVEEYVE